MPNVTIFRLPRKLSPATPPARKLRLPPKAKADKPYVDPLADWAPGFTVDAAKDALDALGATMEPKPETTPTLPDDVTELDNQSLGTLHAQMVAYVNWLEGEMTLAEISADEEEARKEHVEAEVHLVKAGTIADKKAKVKNDLRCIQAEQSALGLRARHKILKTRVRAYERSASALSREMSRRYGELAAGGTT